MAPTFRRKRNRLPLDSYDGVRTYFLTLASAQREPVFTDQGMVAACIGELDLSSERGGFYRPCILLHA